MNVATIFAWLNTPAGIAAAAAAMFFLPKLFPVIGPYLVKLLAPAAPVPLTPATPPATPSVVTPAAHPLLDLLMKLIAQRAAAQGVNAEDAWNKFVLHQVAQQTGVTVDAAPAAQK